MTERESAKEREGGGGGLGGFTVTRRDGSPCRKASGASIAMKVSSLDDEKSVSCPGVPPKDTWVKDQGCGCKVRHSMMKIDSVFWGCRRKPGVSETMDELRVGQSKSYLTAQDVNFRIVCQPESEATLGRFTMSLWPVRK